MESTESSHIPFALTQTQTQTQTHTHTHTHTLPHHQHSASQGCICYSPWTLTYHYHPKSTVCIRNRYYTYHGFEQYVATIIISYRLISLPPKSSVLHIVIPYSLLSASNHCFLKTYLHRFAFSRMPYSWNHTVCTIFRLVSFTGPYIFKLLECLFRA